MGNAINLVSEAGASTAPSMDSIWTGITGASSKFLELFTTVCNFCIGNPLCLIFLGVTFTGIAIRYVRRITHAFGRGR